MLWFYYYEEKTKSDVWSQGVYETKGEEELP